MGSGLSIFQVRGRKPTEAPSEQVGRNCSGTRKPQLSINGLPRASVKIREGRWRAGVGGGWVEAGRRGLGGGGEKKKAFVWILPAQNQPPSFPLPLRGRSRTDTVSQTRPLRHHQIRRLFLRGARQKIERKLYRPADGGHATDCFRKGFSDCASGAASDGRGQNAEVGGQGTEQPFGESREQRSGSGNRTAGTAI